MRLVPLTRRSLKYVSKLEEHVPPSVWGEGNSEIRRAERRRETRKRGVALLESAATEREARLPYISRLQTNAKVQRFDGRPIKRLDAIHIRDLPEQQRVS